jgi:hypothetical protein
VHVLTRVLESHGYVTVVHETHVGHVLYEDELHFVAQPFADMRTGPTRYVKNPDTGKGISRLNPKAEWITKEIPSLRIVSDDLWNAAKDLQSATRRTITRAGNIGFARRPQYLFSGLSKCGVCGGGFIMAGRNRLACFGSREGHVQQPPHHQTRRS